MTTAETRARLITYGQSFHPVGLLVALQFFVWSLTPSLLPRPWFLQGVATGLSIAAGYGIGVLIAWIVRLCGVSPQWSAVTRKRGWLVLAAIAVVVVPTFLILGSWWQEIVRDMVGISRAGRPIYSIILLEALAVALLVLTIARALRRLTNWLTRKAQPHFPNPIARVGALVVVVVLLVLIVEGGFYRGLLGAAEGSAELADQSTAPGVEQPTDSERSGSPNSNEPWETLGKEGRTFVAGGPTADDIEEVTDRPAQNPIRVYAGRQSADTIEYIADNVVAELDRTGAFDRANLAVVTTTGRGWVNQNVAGAFEYVSGGDSAIAAMQYSFLPSPLAFIADRESPQVAGRALFEAVYSEWSERPEATRPKLYVFGESLGSYGGQAAFGSGSDLAARTDGALLVGTPNFAEPWGRITERRDDGSLERLPVVDDGQDIRFAAEPADLDLPGVWEQPRIVFWQHASDPITWWSPDLVLNQPDWLREPLGPDVDPGMRWIPVVTFLQVTFDMVFSADVPAGHGHAYGPEAADLWVDILQPAGWTEVQTAEVREALS